MLLAGVVVTLLGFFISIFSLGMTSSVTARLVIVLVGILVSFVGIIGVINRHYLNNAIWRK
jgi:hypothetical protein